MQKLPLEINKDKCPYCNNIITTKTIFYTKLEHNLKEGRPYDIMVGYKLCQECNKEVRINIKEI